MDKASGNVTCTAESLTDDLPAQLKGVADGTLTDEKILKELKSRKLYLNRARSRNLLKKRSRMKFRVRMLTRLTTSSKQLLKRKTKSKKRTTRLR